MSIEKTIKYELSDKKNSWLLFLKDLLLFMCFGINKN